MKRLIARGEDRREIVAAGAARWFEVYDEETGKSQFVAADIDGWQARATKFIPELCKRTGAREFEALVLPLDLAGALIENGVKVIRRLHSPREDENATIRNGFPFVSDQTVEIFYDEEGVESVYHITRRRGGRTLLLHPVLRGAGIQIHWDASDGYDVFDQFGINRTEHFPGLDHALKHLDCSDCIVQASIFAGSPGHPFHSFHLPWLGGETINGTEYHIEIHDAIRVNGESLMGQEALTRAAAAFNLAPDAWKQDRYVIGAAHAKVVSAEATLQEFKRAVGEILYTNGPGRIGTRFLDAESTFEEEGIAAPFCWFVLDHWTIQATVVGVSTVPARKHIAEVWSSETAKANLDRLLDESTEQEIIVALRSKDGYAALRTLPRMSISDLSFRWEGDKQIWTGIYDPSRWELAKGFEMKPGYPAFARARCRRGKAQIGDVVILAITEVFPTADKRAIIVGPGIEFAGVAAPRAETDTVESVLRKSGISAATAAEIDVEDAPSVQRPRRNFLRRKW